MLHLWTLEVKNGCLMLAFCFSFSTTTAHILVFLGVCAIYFLLFVITRQQCILLPF